MNNDWISVKDKLPEEGVWVFAFREGAEVPFIAKRTREAGYLGYVGWIDYDQGERATPTHWMPIPPVCTPEKTHP